MKTHIPAFAVLILAASAAAYDSDDFDGVQIETDVRYELPVEHHRAKRAAAPYLGPAAYYPCPAPEGFRGSCKPKALCASYYSTSAHYDHAKPNKYKSCTYGYGYQGVCCPDIVYSAKKNVIVKVPPYKRPGYNPKTVQVSPQAIKDCIQYASVEIQGPFENDTDYGRGEDDDSYWGNGVVKELYMSELHSLSYAGFFILLVTKCLRDKYGYNPNAVYSGGGLYLDQYMDLLPPNIQFVCKGFTYPQCSKSKFRTIDGSCNNVKNPYWGAARTQLANLAIPDYSDGLWAIKRPKDGSLYQMPRNLRNNVLPDKDVSDLYRNMWHTYMGQFVAHDCSAVWFYQAHDGSFIDCCHNYRGRPHQVLPKCYATEIPSSDAFYAPVQQKCLNLARFNIIPHYHCAAGYAIQGNRQTAFMDLSATYGTNKAEADSLRNHEYGMLKMSKIGDQYMLPVDMSAECTNSSIACMRSGDLRTTIHPGITIIQTLFVRFHNYCTKKMYNLNPHWNDERLYQECRRINIAVFQKIIYTEYLPLLLGFKGMYDYGILPVSDGYSYDYNENVNPSTLTEFTGCTFRHHSMVYGHINMMDENYTVVETEMLANTYNNPNILMNPAHFDQICRGYAATPQRKQDRYYDYQIGVYAMRDQRQFGLDMGSINMQRGRDYSLRSYNDYREMCGYKRARTFEDFYDFISPQNVALLKSQYRTPDEVELYPAGLMENPYHDSLIGPTWWCITAQQFWNWKVGDRYFYDRGGPYAFTLPQLDAIRDMSFAGLLCSITGVQKIPAFSFLTISEANPLVSCSDYDAIPRMNFGPWKSSPKPKQPAPSKAYKRSPYRAPPRY